ncbi:MAG: MFS transporter [Chloroflexi bacterium]|nr:MFS transporter [Chloroflexota bacterium]
MKSDRAFYFLVFALWLGNTLPALDATLVGTALPTVIGNLGGLSLYSWVFAAHLLGLTVAIPIFGKMTDIFGRKPIYFLGMGLFVVGWLASSVSQTVIHLIVSRAIIGIATAAVQPAAMTIMGDAIPMARRAKIQWVFASAWFTSSIVGPAAASLVIGTIGWRAVFLVPIPLAGIASYLMATQYREQVQQVSRKIDYVGVTLLGGGVLVLLLALSPTNRSAGINLSSSGPLLLAAAVLLATFLWQQRRTESPVLPPRLFLMPVVGIAALGSAASGVAQSGVLSFVPMFVQGGQGGTASDVALVLPWLTIGWPIGAGLGGRLLLRVGFRRSVIFGMTLVMLAQVGFLLMDRESSKAYIAAVMTVMGLGFGFSSVAFMIGVQSSVRWSDRGVATSSLQFFRSIGGSLGVAVMGTIVAMRMQPLFAQYDLGAASSGASALLDPVSRGLLDPTLLDALQVGMTGAIRMSFTVMAVAAVCGLIAVLWFPARLPTPEEDAPEEEATETPQTAA